MGKESIRFINERLGDEGQAALFRGEVAELKRRNGGIALFMLALIRTVSPGRACKLVASQLAYELQWLTPFHVSELNQQRLVIDTPICKVLSYPGAAERCLVCQSVYPQRVAEQFKVNMVPDRQGQSCKLTATPL